MKDANVWFKRRLHKKINFVFTKPILKRWPFGCQFNQPPPEQMPFYNRFVNCFGSTLLPCTSNQMGSYIPVCRKPLEAFGAQFFAPLLKHFDWDQTRNNRITIAECSANKIICENLKYFKHGVMIFTSTLFHHGWQPPARPRFGKALAKLRTRHASRLRASARTTIKENVKAFKGGQVKKNTRKNALWHKCANLRPIFEYLS